MKGLNVAVVCVIYRVDILLDGFNDLVGNGFRIPIIGPIRMDDWVFPTFHGKNRDSRRFRGAGMPPRMTIRHSDTTKSRSLELASRTSCPTMSGRYWRDDAGQRQYLDSDGRSG